MNTRRAPTTTPTFFPPPHELWRDDIMQRHAPAHATDAFLVRQHQTKEHDRRPDLAQWSAPQRIHARQMEPRTAVDCHVRIRRRANPDGS